MQFIYQGLAWGFLLALIPPLIHLINLMRQRRVQWAAMEFLLRSYKKQRKWIWLRQLVLLAMRMAALALVVVMLAQWVTDAQWSTLFGGKDTHHYVLLDDSYSMSQRVGGQTAFDTARQILAQVANRAAAQQTRQRFTLLRFSQAQGGASEAGLAADVDQRADFNGELVGSQFDVRLEEVRRGLEVTSLAVGPQDALELVKALAAQRQDENRMIYLLSDFRENQWRAPAQLRDTLRDLVQTGAELHFVQCAGSEQANLGITRLVPAEGTRAAGVPLFMQATVKNFGREAVRQVQLKVRSLYFDAAGAATPGKSPPQADDLPTVLVDEIPPGESVTRRVQVMFPQPGQHAVQATLADDPVAADNRRWSVVDFPAGEAVLVVDGDPEQRNAYFLNSVFQPGTRAVTGILPEVKPVTFLRDATQETLGTYRVIYLLDVERLDERAVVALEEFVRLGGGLAIFGGEHVNLAFYNERLYQQGRGLLPLPLDRGELLPPDSDDNVPDVQVSDHPVFSVFQGERNPLIRLVSVERYLRAPRDWTAPADSTVRVAARLRNNAPLVVERQFGEGRVLACLTSLAPLWNNWGNDPSFVVVMLQMQAHLAAPLRASEERLVGSTLTAEIDVEKFRPEMSWVAPDGEGLPATVVERVASLPSDDAATTRVRFGPDADRPTRGETQAAGLYEVWLNPSAGGTQARRFALNVEPQEGDLAIAEAATLLQRLEPVKIQYHQADEYQFESIEQAGYNHSVLIMWLLLALLLCEQVVAYFASYHPAQGLSR